MPLQDRNAAAFNMVRDHVWDANAHKVVHRSAWSWNGRERCMHYWAHLTGISRGKIGVVKSQLRDGHQSAQLVHDRRLPAERDREKINQADQFFLNWYNLLSQNQAEVNNKDELDENLHRNEMLEVEVARDNPLALCSIGVDREASLFMLS
jgi:hypothetical protein